MVGYRMHFPNIIEYAVWDYVRMLGFMDGIFERVGIAEVADIRLGVTFINFSSFTIVEHAY